jgi:NADH:ubiquinone oxidoreductase subunit K
MLIAVQLMFNFFLFIIGLIGIIFNYNNLILALVGLELMLLSVTLNFIFMGIYFLNSASLVYAIFLLALAACEAAVGLAILIISFRINGQIDIVDHVHHQR